MKTVSSRTKFTIMNGNPPPTKKRKLNEMNASQVSEADDCFLDTLLNHDISELFGSKPISVDKLERVSSKLHALQKEIAVRISTSNTLSLRERLVKSINCIRAYVGDGDGNVDYESWHCKSEGTFAIGPNKKEIKFYFSGGQNNGCSICEGYIGFDDIWGIDDIEEDEDMELYYDRDKAKQLAIDSGYQLEDNDQSIDDFAEQLTIVCLDKFREKAHKPWEGSIDICFDFTDLWTARKNANDL
eukprot:352968_1